MKEDDKVADTVLLLDVTLSASFCLLLSPFFCAVIDEDAALVFDRADKLSFFDFLFFVTVVSDG